MAIVMIPAASAAPAPAPAAAIPAPVAGDANAFGNLAQKATEAWKKLSEDRAQLRQHFAAIDALIKEVDANKTALNDIHFRQEQLLKDYQSSVRQLVDSKSESFSDIDKKSKFTY